MKTFNILLSEKTPVPTKETKSSSTPPLSSKTNKKTVSPSTSTTKKPTPTTDSKTPTSPTEIIKSYLPYIDLNKQISVESKKGVLLDLIKNAIKDENEERSQSRENKIEISPDEVYVKLKKKITDSLKATRGDVYRDINSKLLWMYILAEPNQTINLQA